MYSQVKASVEEERGAVASIKLDQILTSYHAAGVIGHGDDEVEDDVVCEKLEKVVSVGEPLQALFDDAEERVQGTKVFNVTYQ
jgi:hypothetical protein